MAKPGQAHEQLAYTTLVAPLCDTPPGHRLGNKEIESAALTVPEVAEAAAVPVIDDMRGRVVEMYVSLTATGRSYPGNLHAIASAADADVSRSDTALYG